MGKYYDTVTDAQSYHLPFLEALITNPKYNDLSDAERVVYTVLLDRINLEMQLGKAHEDERGCYLYFRRKELADYMNRSEDAIKRVFSALKKHGMIATRQCGNGKPQKIYLANVR